MVEYIERRAAHDAVTDAIWHGKRSMYDVASAINSVPNADVAPVRHGRWEDSIDEWFGTDVYTCSKCRESYVLVEGTPKENLWHYCPNCGAKMDGGADNG